jgi:hypothetical protein
MGVSTLTTVGKQGGVVVGAADSGPSRPAGPTGMIPTGRGALPPCP